MASNTCLEDRKTVQKEMNRIKHIVKNNNYKKGVVDGAIKRINNKKEKGIWIKIEREDKYFRLFILCTNLYRVGYKKNKNIF